MATVDITIRTIDQNTLQTARKLQAEYDAFGKKLKVAGVSQQAYNQALKEHQRVAAQSVGANQKQGMSFTDLKSAIDLASMALGKMKEAYDFAKEGAQLDFTIQKFDRLAATIGTTGDVLRNNLLEATKGTLSEMEAMGMATDLLSLGLTKTEEDTVRLATVVSGLGMDMNQLVLTLANQTTMRFDQLGVAVVGFDEKVAKLKETGMDANAAFTEAFLQQAEEQLKKVGNAADTNYGQFMKAEAAWKDFTDSLKMGAAEGLGPVLEKMNASIAASEEYYDVLTKVAEANGITVRELRKLDEAETDAMIAEYERTKALEGASRAQANYTAAVEETNAVLPLTEEQIKAISETNTMFLGVLNDVGNAQETYYNGLAQAKEQLDAGKITTEEHAAAVAQLSANYKAASADIVMSIVEMKLAADGWTNAELNAYLDIGVAQGKFTQDQINMTKGAIEQADSLVASYENLGDQAFHAGERTRDAAGGFGVLEEASYELAEGANEAAGGVGAVKSQINNLPPSGSAWEYFFNIRVRGRVPSLPGQAGEAGATGAAGGSQTTGTGTQHSGGRDSGGPGLAGSAYMIGRGAQPEMFVPSTNGQFIPNADKLFDTSGIIAAIEATALDPRTLARSLVQEMQKVWG